MANETTVQTSIFQENPDINECRENIPPGVAAAAETSKLQDQVDVIGYSPQRPSGENEPLSVTCTSSTPAPASSSSGGAKTKSRISGLQSALTPILKYLNIGNKRQSPEPLKCGNNPSVPPFSFGVTTANCQKSPGGSSEHPNSDFSCNHSGQSLGNKDAPVRWLDDEYLPEITLLDVTCDSTMQMTRNDSALPDIMPRSLNGTCSTVQPSKLSSSVNIVNSLQSNVSSPKAESRADDPVRADFKSTTKTSLVMKQNHPCDVQDVTFDNDSVQRSSGNTILGDASALAFHHQNNTLDSKSSCKQNGTLTLSESSDSHQNTMDKPSPPKVCIALTSTEANNSAIHLPKLSKHNGRTAGTDPSAKMVETPERIGGPMRWLDDRYFPEITLLDVTRDSELSPETEISAMEVTQDIPPVDSVEHSRPLSKLSGLIVAEPDGRDMLQSEELSTTLTGSVTHSPSSFSEQSKSAGGNLKTSLEATLDDSVGGDLRNNISSSELSGQNIMKSQISAEYTLGIHPTNVTHDISSSSDVSVQCVSQLSTSDVQSNTSLKNVTSELHVKPVETNIEELLTSHDAELKGEAQQTSPKRAASINNTFNVAQAANLSSSTSLNSTNQISCPQNMTLDLPPTEVNSPKAESVATDPVSADFKDTTDTCLVMDHTNSAVKASGPCEVQNATFDRHSLQKSGGSTTLGEAGATTFCLQNNTFDSKPVGKQNGTITLSETSSSDSHQNSLDKPSPSNVCNPTDIHEVNTSEVLLSEESKQNGTTTRTDPDAEMTDSAENTFEANPAVEAAPGAGRRETKDHSQSVTDDAMDHQGMDTENNNANTFNLDDTLDLKVDSLVTSTPMTHCKVFQFSTEHHKGKTLGAQKKLYGDGPSRPVGQVSSDVPSNIVRDRKTFLAQPAAKSLLPPLKTASQLMKYKPTSTLPGRCEPSTSGLPMTRQRTQAEALKSAAPSDAAQGTTGISSSYNLRATTTGSKHPNSGLLRPLLSGIPSGIQRTATSLRPPSARSNAPASSSDKLRGPTATNPVTKTLQLKKHPLTRGEPLPTAKRKKLDTPLPSSSADASTSSCDAVNRAKHLKQPATVQRALPAKAQRDDATVPASTAETSTSCNAASRARVLKPPANGHRAQPAKPQSHGCAKCVALEEQLKVKSEEIRRLKEELLKYSKQ